MSFERVPDPRALRTRQAIFDAVERLAADSAAADSAAADSAAADSAAIGGAASRPGEPDITVSDIVRVAGISRSSFYVHFDDVADVAAGVLAESFARIEVLDARDAAVRDNVDALRLGYARLVDHLTDRYAFYSSLRALPPMRGAYDDAVTGYCRDLVRSVLPADLPPGIDAEFTARYVAGGSLAVIGGWIGGRLDGTDDELVDHLVAQLPGWLIETSPSHPVGSRSGSRSTRSLTKGTT
ncbi:TetR/AcrR family transcriptional regulator [Microbacteriaceae bacterium VKM Ac-2855]|nr:TetR/AcrR family transcriptional regulator [Microbacteriaceae bacterium VKM Ac-2855]